MSNLSPAPGTPQTGAKAYAATALAFLSIFVGAWVLDTDPVTAKEVASWLVNAAIGSGITGGAAFFVKNSAKEEGRAEVLEDLNEIDPNDPGYR